MPPFFFRFLTLLVYFVFRLLGFTYRIYVANPERVQKAKQLFPNRAHLLAVWHQNVFAGLQSEKSPHVIMISPSKDGEFAAVVCTKLGHTLVRGSSNKRSKEVLLEMIKLVQKGHNATLSVDGPRGPKYEVKAGIIEIARQTGAYILPFTALPANYWAFKKSWDQFRLPKPFTKIMVAYGEPFVVPAVLSEEEFDKYREQLKEELMKAEKIAQEKLKSSQTKKTI